MNNKKTSQSKKTSASPVKVDYLKNILDENKPQYEIASYPKDVIEELESKYGFIKVDNIIYNPKGKKDELLIKILGGLEDSVNANESQIDILDKMYEDKLVDLKSLIADYEKPELKAAKREIISLAYEVRENLTKIMIDPAKIPDTQKDWYTKASDVLSKAKKSDNIESFIRLITKVEDFSPIKEDFKVLYQSLSKLIISQSNIADSYVKKLGLGPQELEELKTKVNDYKKDLSNKAENSYKTIEKALDEADEQNKGARKLKDDIIEPAKAHDRLYKKLKKKTEEKHEIEEDEETDDLDEVLDGFFGDKLW